MKKFFAFTIALTAIFAVSCQKEKELHPVGSNIVFTAATEYKNGVETRTIYSGDYTGSTPNYERIQWLSTDDVEILYSHGSNSSAQYDISNIQGSGTQRKSTADVTLKSGSSALQWADGNTHKFFGVYPAPNSGNGLSLSTVTSGGNLNGRVNGLVIPDHQTATWDSSKGKYLPDMSKAYMVSYADYSQNPETTVALPFTPVMSAFEFKLKLPDNRPSYTVSKVQLSASTNIAGGYSVDITGYDSNSQAVTWAYTAQSSPTPKTSVVVSFDNNGATQPAIPTSTSGTDLDFTLFTLPVSISNPVLSIKYYDGTVKQVTLTGLTLAAGQKVVVSNNRAGHDTFTYEISSPSSQTVQGHNAATFNSITVDSHRTSSANSSYSEAVNWKVQYYDVNNYWVDGSPTGWTVSRASGSNTFTISLNSPSTAGIDNTITSFDASTQILKQRASKGTASAPYDLCRDDGTANAGTAAAVCRTANCYVISAPGVYKFPIVYGNAITNPQGGTDYKLSSYVPYESTESITGTTAPGGSAISQLRNVHLSYNGTDNQQVQTYYLPRFYNAACDGIQHPFIFSDLARYGTVSSQSATILYQSSNNIIRSSSVSLIESNNWVKFEIRPEDIKPGNIIIAVKCTAGTALTNEIVWSWHIWVTDKDISPVNGFMPVNLGFVEDNNIHNGTVSKYPNRTQTFRVIQTDANGNILSATSNPNSGVYREFTLTQEGDVLSNSSTVGTNTYYQWGRKDPFESASGSTSNPGDNGAGIRAPRTKFAATATDGSTTVNTHSWLSGVITTGYPKKVYPYYSSGTTTTTYTIKPTSEKRDFLLSDASRLNDAGFSVPADWTVLKAAGWYVPDSHTLRTSGYGGQDVVDFWVATGYNPLTGSTSPYQNDFEQYDAANNLWRWKSNRVPGRGPFNATVTIALNEKLKYNGGTQTATYFPPDWDYYAEPLLHTNTANYNFGPYTQENYDILIAHGFSASDFTTSSSTVWTPYTSVQRWSAAIPYNLWNAYIYSENGGDPYDNKFKTIYDPCPVGYTVPTKDELNVTGYPAGNYWTDHPTMIKLTSGQDPTVISSFYDYNKAYLKSSGTTATASYRSTAASIRPMRDPKDSRYPASSSSPGNVGGSLEGVSTGNNLF